MRCCESTSEERRAGNLHAAFCGSRRWVTASGDPVTHAGQLVRALQENSFDHPDPQRRYATWWLVPDGFSERATVERMRKIKSPS